MGVKLSDMSTSAPVVDTTISATIKALAKARGVHVDTIAEVIGVSTRTLWRYFDHGGWSANHVARLAEFFDTTVADLYDGRIEHVLPRSKGTANIKRGARSSTDRASDYGSGMLVRRRPFLDKVA